MSDPDDEMVAAVDVNTYLRPDPNGTVALIIEFTGCPTAAVAETIAEIVRAAFDDRAGGPGISMVKGN